MEAVVEKSKPVYVTPLDSLVAEMVEGLDATLREEFEERAAIIEFEAKESCAHAECLALLCVLHRHPAALKGVTALQVEIEGISRWLLTTDVQVARQRLALAGGFQKGTYDLDSVIERQYSGLAFLAPFSEARTAAFPEARTAAS